MDITRLKTFCKVYELKSFSRASKELFVSQPTVSSHILALEKELGGSLFDRMGKNIVPTPAGEVLYKYARQVIGLIDLAVSEVHFLKNHIVGNLRLGGSTIPGHYILPPIISEYTKKYPKVSVYLEISDSTEILSKVSKGDIDLGIVGVVPKDIDLEYIKLLEDELVFVGKKKFFQCINGIDDLLRLPWIIREKGSGTRTAMEQGLIDAGLSIEGLNIKVCVSNSQGLLNLVNQGIGITLTSIFAAQELSLSSREIEIKRLPFFRFNRDFVLVWRKCRTLLPAAVFFKDFIKKICVTGSILLKTGGNP